jgi:hypothetical protein
MAHISIFEGSRAMSIKTPTMSRTMLVLPAAVALCNIASYATAADLAVGQRYRSAATESRQQAHATGDVDITGTISARATASVSSAPMTAMASHALAARAHFIEVRSVMERGIVLGAAASKADIEAVHTHMKELQFELDALDHLHQSGSADRAKRAAALARAWCQDGLKIMSPPSEGVLELPLPMNVIRQAEGVAAAIDQLVEKTPPDTTVQRIVR